jgi:hypothetical protein
MTFGVMPTREAFADAFAAECPRGEYRITLASSDARNFDGTSLGTGSYSESQLWHIIQEIMAMGPDDITVSEDDECENVYQVFYHRDDDTPPIEIGPAPETLIEWANKFSGTGDILIEHRAVECLNYAAAYGETGKCYDRQDERESMICSIMGTLGFEWI